MKANSIAREYLENLIFSSGKFIKNNKKKYASVNYFIFC